MTKLRRLHTILRRGRRAEQRRVAARSSEAMMQRRAALSAVLLPLQVRLRTISDNMSIYFQFVMTSDQIRISSAIPIQQRQSD